MTLNVSDRAIEMMTGVLESRDAPEDEALRLARNEDGDLGLILGEVQEGDQVFTRDDRPILFIDDSVSSGLDGATLDVVDTPDGARLALRPPDLGPAAPAC